MSLAPPAPRRARTTAVVPAGTPHPPLEVRRLRALVVAAVSAVSLVPVLATPAAAADPVPAPPCSGPTIIDGGTPTPTVAVGTTKTQKLRFDLATQTACGPTGATVSVRTPQGTRTVQLVVVSRDEDRVRWKGSLSITPRSLRNDDAGRWRTTFRVTGDQPGSLTVDSSVRRAVRMRFNAGPEPVRDGRITYSGHLERASWNTRTYHDLVGRTVSIYQIRLDEEDMDEIAATTTDEDGRFRLTRTYYGPGYYVGVYDGTRYTASLWSRRDRVDTPA